MNIGRLYRNVLWEPPVPSATPVYKTTLTTTTNENTTTWTGQDIGTPHRRRVVILAGYHGVAAAATGTVNGNAFAYRAQNTTHEWAIMVFEAPVGTTADITVTATSSIRKAISVYVAYPRTWMPRQVGNVSAATTTDATVSGFASIHGGFVIYAGGQHATLGTFTTTWTGTASGDVLTEDVDAQLEAAASYTAGWVDIRSSSASRSLTLAESTSGTKRLVLASFEPSFPSAGIAVR